MFDFIKKRCPPTSPENPGQGNAFNLNFSEYDKASGEQINLARLLSEAFKEKGISHKLFDHYLLLPKNFYIQPQILEVDQKENGVRTATTIEISCAKLAPRSFFEFQHSWGASAKESILNGFKYWIDLELQVYLEAIDGLDELSQLKLDFSETFGQRLVILGRTLEYATEKVELDDEHPFCPCCLYMKSFDAFESLLKSNDIYGIKLFAMSNGDGTYNADCRVNGIDFEAGKNALIEYAKTWPNRGYEYRKQYVFLKTDNELKA